MLSANAGRVDPDSAFRQVERQRLDVASGAIPTRNPHDDCSDAVLRRTPRPIHDSAAIRGAPCRRSFLAHCRTRPARNGRLTRGARPESRAKRKSQVHAIKRRVKLRLLPAVPPSAAFRRTGFTELGHFSPEPRFVNALRRQFHKRTVRAFSMCRGNLQSPAPAKIFPTEFFRKDEDS